MSGCEGLGRLISQTVSRSVGQIVIETIDVQTVTDRQAHMFHCSTRYFLRG